MAKNLIIVESPAKAPTIKRFLGEDYTIMASMGHIRDLPEKNLGVDVKNNYNPDYRISSDKHKIIKDLKKAVEESDQIWLATDEDREGEAISWHLAEALQLPEEKTKRIVFHEITKKAILEALENPREINYDLVNAQQARRVLDRLVGFELSPLLWRKVMPKLSAGRVQSVAVRLIVDREEEINNFNSDDFYKIGATFHVEDKSLLAEAADNFKTREPAEQFLQDCISASYKVKSIEKKPASKTPPPPFTTSTLQQEASRKLSFTVSKTMMIAQQLYESGKITYMRTDSVNLSELALSTTRKEIIDTYGEKYYKRRQYSTKSRGAQEAHEAIRPTYINESSISGSRDQQRLYELIRKRTLACQMSDALLERTSVSISISTRSEKLYAKAEMLIFDGFLQVYNGMADEEEDAISLLPPLKTGQQLELDFMDAMQRFTQQPVRYNEAMLVRKLEELGIGRPSTYAPIISTIQKRKYVEKLSKPALERTLLILRLRKGKISEKTKKEKYNAQKNKLFPTDIGTIVNKFLTLNFQEIMDFNFTASVEEEFDRIANGEINWQEMIDIFYKPFHALVEKTGKESERFKGSRELGIDPESGRPVFARLGRYGPMIQIGEAEDKDKPRFASLQDSQRLETITLAEALKLFAYPRTLGSYNDEEVLLAVGRYGPYIKCGKRNFSLERGVDTGSVTLAEAIIIIEDQQEKTNKKMLREFSEEPAIKVLNGRYGAYITYNKTNYRIPEKYDAETLTLEECRQIIEETPKKLKRGKKKS
ncbi:MAG: type I DNA topoisomerase [Candidatus Cloacimonetes bacterium]|nr:type I DNA topoisomerase [Candidatus Cloacimonadota bacterium]